MEWLPQRVTAFVNASKNMSVFSLTVLTTAFCYTGFKIFSFFINKLKIHIIDWKNTVFRGGIGLFFGSPQDLMETVIRYLEKAEPTPYTFWLGYVRYVVIGRPEDLQEVLNNSNCLEKSNFYKFFKNSVGEGLFSSPVEKWKKHRRLLTPAFSLRMLDTFFSIFNAKSERLVGKLKREVDTGEYFDLWPYISTMALDLICQTMMGLDIDALGSAKNEFQKALKKLSEEESLRIYKPWLHPDFIFNLYVKFAGLTKYYKLLHSLPEQIIKRKQNELREKKRNLPDNDAREKSLMSFLDLLLDQNGTGEVLSDTNIRDETITMIIGGSETSALTVSFMLLMLAMNPEIQERAYKEINQVLGNNERPILLEDTNKMVFLEQCIRETLRLFPPGPLILRRATKDVLLSDNFILRSGANIVIPPFKVHRDPNLYKNPLIWNPENFAAEEVAKRHKYSFIAFSGGPRGCIGSKYAMFSMKITVAMILQKYVLRTEVKLEDIRLSLDLLMRSVHGYKVKLYSRELKNLF